MTRDLAAFLAQFHGRSLLLDANLLLVLAIGRSDPLLIARHKKTRGEYSEEDYNLLIELVGAFAPCITTPHILTEVSNQIGQISGPLLRDVFQGFSELIQFLMEDHIPSREVAVHERFPDFGLTDLGILNTARRANSLVITADSTLAAFLCGAEIDALAYQWMVKVERGR